MTQLTPRRALVYLAFFAFAIVVGAAFAMFVYVAQPGWWTPMPIAPGS